MNDSASVATAIFFNRGNELRSGWRVLVFLVLLLVALTFTQGALAALSRLIPALSPALNEPAPSGIASESQFIYIGLSQLLTLAVALAVTALCARLLEGRSLASVGYELHDGWLRDFGAGCLLGAVTISIAVAIAAGAGAVRFAVQDKSAATLVRSLAAVGLVLLLAAAFEELIFRGFIFQALLHNIGPAATILITSLVFGLMHLWNPNSTLFSTLNTILAGVWLGVAYLLTRSLWLATGLHWSWNFVMAFVFGLPVSGIVLYDRTTWLDGQPGPSEWLSGGSYGPEGGAAATLALMLCTLFLWKSKLFAPARERMKDEKEPGSYHRVS